MDAVDEFMTNHNESLLKALGIEIVEGNKSRVVGRLALDGRHVTEFGSVQGGMVMAMADIVGAFGAVLNLSEGYVTTTLESKTNFLSRGAGRFLWAESEPVHLGRTTSVWRTIVWRGNDADARTKISEVTQTQLNLPIDRKDWSGSRFGEPGAAASEGRRQS